MARTSALQQIMDEPVEYPGFPQIIVIRGWLYQHLKSLGWDESERGYSSLDYTVFSRQKVDQPVTDEETREYWLNSSGILEYVDRRESIEASAA